MSRYRSFKSSRNIGYLPGWQRLLLGCLLLYFAIGHLRSGSLSISLSTAIALVSFIWGAAFIVGLLRSLGRMLR